jgi:thiol-disulfide isomerase/thioredoxin
MSRGLRIFGALIALLGIWVGVKMRPARVPPEHEVAVSAGMASAPEPEAGSVSDAEKVHPVIPTRLPEFSLKNLTGKPTPISAWAGKSLVINFWATWCAPCRREIPLLKELATEWAGRDLKVVGVAVDHLDKVQAFAGQFNIDYPVLIGEQDALDVAAQFGMDSPVFPFTVFIDRRGEVVALFVGELHRPQVDFILSKVQDLNHDRVQLTEARRAIAQGLQALAGKQAE